jgi:5-carboxymethyl-2-hydroxymuconate isomerase
MPHLTLEYSSNLNHLDPQASLNAINRTLVASGQFEELDIKSRALKFDDFVIGNQHTGHAFAHAKLAILTGRSVDTKRTLSEQVLATLQSSVPEHVGLAIQLCVEIVEIERESYTKAVVSS